MKERQGTLRIRTPEGILFSLPLASPVTRGVALAIDFFCIAIATATVQTALPILGHVRPDFAKAAAVIAFFTIAFGYSIVMEMAWRGQTVGKRLLGLRVIDEEGLRLTSSQIAVRNLLRVLDALPAFYLVGGIACLLTPKTQRLGDLAAGTVVVRSARIERPDLDQVMAGRFNSLREVPHLCARLRQGTNPSEASIALQALMRRDALAGESRLELFRDIANHFRAKVNFPEELVAELPDEQFVRNVVDILFQTRK